MYYKKTDPKKPIKVKTSIYNNASTIAILIRSSHSVKRIKFFLEEYGHYYSLKKITNFLKTPFFKKRLEEYLKQVNDNEDYLSKLDP